MLLKNEREFYNRFLWILSFGFIGVFLVLNMFTPLIADDYFYSLGINSIADIVKYQYRTYYFEQGGRCIAHFFAQFWLFCGKPFFNIANTLVYCTFIILIQYHITGKFKKVNPALFLTINIFFWYATPAWGQNFLWLDGSCNYLWTTTIILLFLVPFKAKYESKDYDMNMVCSILFFIAGILAGCTNENSGAAVLFLLIAYFVVKIVKKEKWSLFEFFGGVGFLIGFIVLIAAPGNYVRMNFIAEVKRMDSPYVDETLIKVLLKRFLDISATFIKNNGFLLISASVIFGIDLIYHQKRKLNLFSCFYAMATLASVYSMILSPSFPDRAVLIVLVFSIITFGSVLIQYGIKIPEIIKRNAVIVAISLAIIFSFSGLKGSKNIVGIYLKWQQRIEYIQTEKEKGNFDIAVKAPIPATDKHAALYDSVDISDDENAWPNPSIAEYFGLRSIKRLDIKGPWK